MGDELGEIRQDRPCLHRIGTSCVANLMVINKPKARNSQVFSKRGRQLARGDVISMNGTLGSRKTLAECIRPPWNGKPIFLFYFISFFVFVVLFFFLFFFTDVNMPAEIRWQRNQTLGHCQRRGHFRSSVPRRHKTKTANPPPPPPCPLLPPSLPHLLRVGQDSSASSNRIEQQVE